MRGLVFVGCSFTWGQGLHYYSSLSNIKHTDDYSYDRNLLTDAHLKHIEANRFPRTVANNFNTFEIVKNDNGGGDEDSLKFLKKLFNADYEHYDAIVPVMNYEDIEYIIFQTSYFMRNSFYYDYKGEHKYFNLYNTDPENKADFYEWLIEEKKCYSLDEWKKEHIKTYLDKIKNLLKYYESKGIKTLIICWKNDYIEEIQNDIWLYNRYLTIDYNDNKYDCIQDLIDKNYNMCIANDTDSFEKPPNDFHLSKFGHDIIAQSIIEKINKDERNTLDYDLYYNEDNEFIKELLKDDTAKKRII